MAVYGFKDNKCKAEIPTVFADLTDEFPGGSYSDVPSIATVGNSMPENSVAFYHVNSSGFPGSGNGTIIALKPKGGQYKNYLFFDTTQNRFFAIAADGTSKTWSPLLTIRRTYSSSSTVNAGSSRAIQMGGGQFDANTTFTVEVNAVESGTTTAAALLVNGYFGDDYSGFYCNVKNLSDVAVDYTIKVRILG